MPKQSGRLHAHIAMRFNFPGITVINRIAGVSQRLEEQAAFIEQRGQDLANLPKIIGRAHGQRKGFAKAMLTSRFLP